MIERMTKLLLIASVFTILPMAAFSQERSIKEIRIHQVGQTSLHAFLQAGRNSIKECRSFKPSMEQVEHHFKHAYPVDSQHADLFHLHSPCFANGSITFSDDSVAQWDLHANGALSLIFSNDDYVDLYYKHIRWIAPKKCVDGMSGTGTC
jgi:hypothetical protein